MDIKEVLNEIINEEIRKYIVESTSEEYYHIMLNDEPIDTFSTKEEADKFLIDNKEKGYKVEKSDCKTYGDMIDKLDELGENMENLDENKQACNECGGELTEGICLECEKSTVNENKKRVLRLTETEMKNLILNIIQESEFSVPSVTKTSQTQNGKDSNEHIQDVNKKIKDNGMSDDTKPNKKKMARKNTEEQEKEIEEDRGFGLEDIQYDVEPNDKFKERAELAIVGDSSMGNSPDWVNANKTDLGKKIVDKVKRKKEKLEKQPMYDKDPQPVKIVKESKEIVKDEMLRMKEMYNYNKKTQ